MCEAGEGKPRIVLGTNVLISALGWNGPERRLYRACLAGELQLRISMPLIHEWIRVMSHPKLGFPVEDQRMMVQDVLRIGDLIEDLPEVHAVPDDPADDQVLACAVAGRADVVVTGDMHLLSLGSFAGIPIMRAADVERDGRGGGGEPRPAP